MRSRSERASLRWPRSRCREARRRLALRWRCALHTQSAPTRRRQRTAGYRAWARAEARMLSEPDQSPQARCAPHQGDMGEPSYSKWSRYSSVPCARLQGRCLGDFARSRTFTPEARVVIAPRSKVSDARVSVRAGAGQRRLFALDMLPFAGGVADLLRPLLSAFNGAALATAFAPEFIRKAGCAFWPRTSKLFEGAVLQCAVFDVVRR